MPHDAAFADSVRPMRSVILRLALRPYSIGHELILAQRGNLLTSPLPSPPQSGEGESHSTAVADRSALIRAVDVCSQTWAENNFIPKTRWQKWRMRRVWRKWEKSLKHFTQTDWDLARMDFLNYRAAGSLAPHVSAPDGPCGREMGAPFIAALIQFVVRNLGKTEEQAFDYPLGLAKFHYYTAGESEGMVKILNRHEIEFEEYCRREDQLALDAAKEKLKMQKAK